MKLIRLKIFESFRSLPTNFEVHFLQKIDENKVFEFNPYCLVGRNGSGKSNILEALAAIFYHLECMELKTLPASFVFDAEENPYGFSSDKAVIDAFELEYFINTELTITTRENDKNIVNKGEKVNAHILVKKEKGKSPEYKWVDWNKTLKDPLPQAGVTIRRMLPDYILGYSSGENEILSLPFFKMRFIHYDEYEQALRKQLPYAQPEGKLIYFDNSFSQAVFLTNYLMQDQKVLQPIYKTLGIKGIFQFRIIIRLKQIKEFYEPLEYGFDSLKGGVLDSERVKLEIPSRLTDLIQLFKNCATTWENDEDTLFLDYCIDAETKKAFNANFDNDPIKLFQSFQILLTLNLYEVSDELKQELYQSTSLYVNETVPVLASDKRIMRFKDLEIDNGANADGIYNKSLSDGEHQFLHAMGVCLLFKNSSSLFLLDEPETHFNPDWRSLFISTLRDCLEQKDDKIHSEFIITSHSPFIVSDCRKENVLVFEKQKGKSRKVKVSRPDFNTFGASVNLLTHKLFHKEQTISEIANKRLNDVMKKFKKGKLNLEQSISMANQLGDSVEKLIIIDELKRLKPVLKKKPKSPKKK